ncbi:MAG TPA: hypothetical protein PKY59_21230 [Pyrinomonadaceae bacterium]|nr:hypothetical protein [Pyrinomonadaceae bacterium]
MKKLFLFLIAITIFNLTFTSEIFACACCAERGEYRISTSKPSDYDIDLLSQMKYSESAELYTNEAGFDAIKGLNSIKKGYEDFDWSSSNDYFSLTNSFAAKTWKFTFKTKDGKNGVLTLPMPTQMVEFATDTHENEGTAEPVLYKEWRFKGTVQSGNGFFSAGIAKPTTYFLVLQGRGNNCNNAEDFSHWRLEINGKKANYAFFGKMNTSEAAE